MSQQTFTKADLERVQNTFQKIVNQYRIALADSIRRPMGVIPDSAKNLISDSDLQMAETRRQLFNQEADKNESAKQNFADVLIKDCI
jgi:hypothetical protein